MASVPVRDDHPDTPLTEDAVTPLDAAFHDWADANEGATSAYDGFAGGWAARQPEVELAEEERERTRVFWQTKVASVEAERDMLIQRLATVVYERDAFRRQRDAVAGMIERSREATS